MTPKEHIRETIILEVRKLDPEKFESLSDKEIGSLIFRNTRAIRLKKSGWDILRKHFDSEQFELSRRLNGKELILLQNKMKYPYFLSAKNIYLFNTKDIFTLKLLGGDVSKWLT